MLPPAKLDLRVAAFSVHASVPAQLRLSGILHVTNVMASFHPYEIETELGAERTTELTLNRNRPRHVFAIEVPAGTIEVRAQIGVPSSKEVDVDVYLFSCVDGEATLQKLAVSSTAALQGKCMLRAAGNAWSGGIATAAFPTNALTLTGPLPIGRWVAVVDAYRLPFDPVHISFTDTIINHKYGFMLMRGRESYIHSHERSEQAYTIVRGVSVPPGRRLVAFPGIAASEGDTIWAKLTGHNWNQLARSRVLIQHDYNSVFTDALKVSDL